MMVVVMVGFGVIDRNLARVVQHSVRRMGADIRLGNVTRGEMQAHAAGTGK